MSAIMPLRLTILALGSRGDVQPFVALALALRARGHTVRIAAPADYAPLIEEYNLPFAILGGLIREQMDMPRVAAMLDGAGNPLRFAADTLPQIMPLVGRLVGDAAAASADADALIVSTLGAYPGLSVAEKRGIPLVLAHFHPLAETSAEQHVNFPGLPTWVPQRARYNRITHFLGAHGLWQLLRVALNRARRDVLGLRPLSPAALVRGVRALDRHVVFGYSRHLAPLPHAASAAGLDTAVTGFWFLPHAPAWQPDPALAAFLAAGPPPIYVGFGSNLTGRTPDALTAMYVEAFARIGSRGLFFGGWGDFANIPLPPTILRVDSIPHDWLFARVAAAVHHGGAGSTSAAVAAGIPAVAMPFLGDQFFWARQLHVLGCGPAPLVRGSLTADQLAAALADLVGNPTYRTRAQGLGAQLRAEGGAAAAAAWIEARLPQDHLQSSAPSI
jgi:UDP:flavonoid glycosyltransferase YjiC (YdhE family)